MKVADFGVARFQSQKGIMTAETGTYRWMAPEVFSRFTLCLINVCNFTGQATEEFYLLPSFVSIRVCLPQIELLWKCYYLKLLATVEAERSA